jgi:DnaJ-class molecular chaperone
MSLSKALATLQLDRGASHEEIKERFYELAKVTHPDQNPSADAAASFIELAAAAELLIPKSQAQNRLEVPDDDHENDMNRATWFYEHVSSEMDAETRQQVKESTADTAAGGPDWGGWWQMADMMQAQQLEDEEERKRLEASPKRKRRAASTARRQE